MITRLLDTFFGCWHNRYSFPITVRSRSRSKAGDLTGTYVVCLNCGTELPYDWESMKVINSPAQRRDVVRSLAAKSAV